MKSIKSYIITLLALVSFACEVQERGEKQEVLCTTNILADIYQNILPKSIEVNALMGPGVDPHTYQFKSQDIQAIQNTPVFIVNGLYLEGNLEEMLPQIAQQRVLINLGGSIEGAQLVNKDQKQDSFDPHFWMDLPLLIKALENSLKPLKDNFPEHRDSIEANFLLYKQELLTLHEMIQKEFKAIPQEKRKLITAHDAFSYYARAYKVEVHAIQGVSTSVDYSIKELLDLKELIVASEIPAIFLEHSVAPQSIEKLKEMCFQSGYEIRIGGTLYSDALGAVNSPANSFVDYMKYNSETIIQALK